MSPSAPFMHAITAKVNRMRAPVAALHPLAQFTSARSCYHLRSLHGRSEDRGCDVGVWPDTVAVSKYMWFAWVSPLLRALLPRATWMLSYNRCRVFVCCLVSFWQFVFRLSTLYAVWIGPKALALGGRFAAICKWSYLIHASIFIHFVHSSCCPSCGTAAVYDSGCDRMSGPPGAI
jgi:hypothetical protein